MSQESIVEGDSWQSTFWRMRELAPTVLLARGLTQRSGPVVMCGGNPNVADRPFCRSLSNPVEQMSFWKSHAETVGGGSWCERWNMGGGSAATRGCHRRPLLVAVTAGQCWWICGTPQRSHTAHRSPSWDCDLSPHRSTFQLNCSLANETQCGDVCADHTIAQAPPPPEG